MAKRRVVLNDVTDPHEGLRLLSERPKFSADQLADPEKGLLAEQRWRFWRHLFELQIAFEERGEVLALAHGLVACQMCREVPPRWLARAAAEYITQQLPKSQAAMERCRWRWRTVVKAKASGLTWREAYAAASDELQGTFARGGEDTMKDEYAIANRLGGEGMTLQAYRAEMHKQAQKRAEKKRRKGK